MTDGRPGRSSMYVDEEQGCAGSQEARALNPPDRSRPLQPEHGVVGRRGHRFRLSVVPSSSSEIAYRHLPPLARRSPLMARSATTSVVSCA
jgi:hypothetical protein